jgi:hypothetical protein
MPAPKRQNPSRQNKKNTVSLPGTLENLAPTDDGSATAQKTGRKPPNAKRQYNASDTEDVPSKKKAKTVDKGGAAPRRAKAKGTAKPTPIPRSPLPSRETRNEHPGNVAKARPKRTSAEVAAAQAQKEEKKRKLEELEREKKRILAEILIEEEDADLECESNAVRRLSDILASDGVDPGVEGEESDAQMVEEELEPTIDEPQPPPQPKTVSRRE